MKKSIILSTLLSISLFAANDVSKTITAILNGVGKNFPGFKKSSVVINKYDEKLNVDLGIAKIETKNNSDLILYMYYPKAKSLQLIDPASFKMLANVPEKNYMYMDDVMKTVFTKYIQLKRYMEIKKLQERKKTILKLLDKNNGIVFLQKDPNKDTILLFLDPNCPYCIQKINSVNFKEILKTRNVAIIPLPLVKLDKNNNVVKNESLHPNAFALSTNIISSIRPNMSAEEKLKIIRKYMIKYNDNNFKRINDKKAKEKVLENYNEFLKTGVVQGTPTAIILNKEESKKLFDKMK